MRPTPQNLAHRMVRPGEDPYPDPDIWPLLVGLEHPLFVVEQFKVPRRQHNAVEKYIRLPRQPRTEARDRLDRYDFWRWRRTSNKERLERADVGSPVNLHRLYKYANLPTTYHGPYMTIKPETTTGMDLCDMWGVSRFVSVEAAADYFGVEVDGLYEAADHYGCMVEHENRYSYHEILPALGFVSEAVLHHMYPDENVKRIFAMRAAVCVPELVSGLDLARITAQQWHAVQDLRPEQVARHRGWHIDFCRTLFMRRFALL